MAHPNCMVDWRRHFEQRDRRRVSVAWAVVGLVALGPSLTGALVWMLS